MLALAAGTGEQFAMLQEAVLRWWEPIMHFLGTNIPADEDPSMHWGIKPQTNETSRQAWMSQYVPRLWDMGIELPDPNLRWDPDDEVWHYTEPDWDRLKAIVKGEGTDATRIRLFARWAEWTGLHRGRVARDGPPVPRPPGSHLVTTTTTPVDLTAVRAAVGSVPDPELPPVTLAMFGPTPCRDVRFCNACQQPFEAFRS